MEIVGHFTVETVEASVDVDKIAVLGGYEMDRSDAVIERKFMEIAVRRSPLRSEIVNLHRLPEAGGCRVVFFPQPAHLVEKHRHIGFCHVARRAYRYGRMGRESVMAESALHGLGGKHLHRGLAVAELGVGMEIIKIGSGCEQIEVHQLSSVFG